MAIENEDVIFLGNWTGLDSNTVPWLSKTNTFSECKNFFLGYGGELVKRGGIKRIGTAGEFPIGVYKTDTFNRMIFFHPSGCSWADVSGANIGTLTAISGISVPARGCAQANDILYIATTSGVYKWNGTGAATLVSGSPNCKQIHFFKSRLWAVSGDSITGTSTKRQRFYWSDPTPPTTNLEQWQATSFVDIGAGAGTSDALMSAVPFGDRFMMFKEHSIWNYYLTDDPVLNIVRLMNSDIGATGQYATQSMQNQTILFVDSQGVYATDGVVFKELSRQISNEFDFRAGYVTPSMNQDFISAINEVLLVSAYSPSAGRNKLWAFRMEAPSGWTELVVPVGQPSKVWEAKNTLGNHKWIFGDNLGLTTWSLDRTSLVDETSPGTLVDIACSFQTNPVSGERPNRMHRLKHGYMYMSGNGNTPTVKLQADPSYEDEMVSKFDFVPVSYHSSYHFPGNVWFRELSVRLEETSQLPLVVSGISLITSLKRNQSDAQE